MRNRALIARWVYEHSDGVVRLVKKDGKTYIDITDYQALRSLFAKLLAEIQRIKSEGDYDAAKELVEMYAINIDPALHSEVLERYAALDIAPYKGFINPWMKPVYDENDNIVELELRGYLSATDGNYRPLGTFTVIVYTKGDKLYGSII